MNHEYAQDRARSRFANTSHNDQDTIGVKKSNHAVRVRARGTAQYPVVRPVETPDENLVTEETFNVQLDDEVDAESETLESHDSESTSVNARGSMDKAWRRLLRFLGNGDEQEEAAVYEHVRNRLLQFFAARGKLGDEELADATFDRVVSKLSDEIAAQVRCPVGYMLRFAHFIYLEHIKGEISRRNRLAALPPDESDCMENAQEEWLRNQRLALVEQCLSELPPEERTLLLSYYMHDGRLRIVARQKLSQELGITPALLRTRVSRLLSAFNRRVRTLAEEAALA